MRIALWFLGGVALVCGVFVSLVVSGEMIDTEWRENDPANLFFADARP